MVWFLHWGDIFRSGGSRVLSDFWEQGVVSVWLSYGSDFGITAAIFQPVQDYGQWGAVYFLWEVLGVL